MRSTATMRQLWHPPCKRPTTVVELHSGARLRVAVGTEDAWRAVDAIMAAHGYHPRREDTGAYNCRAITGGTNYSLHAYGIAADFNWRTNPYGRKLVTDMPPAMVADIVGLRTVDGAPVFRWGGDWDGRPGTPHRYYDAMHFELQASPEELARGLNLDAVGTPLPVPPAPVRPPAPVAPTPGGRVVVQLTLPVLAVGDKGPAVRKLQRLLRDYAGQKVTVDGAFGPSTKAAVEAVQRFFKLTADGVAGKATWGALALAAFPTA